MKPLRWVFPEWLSLNLPNSVNHDKIQEQYGYTRYSLSVNRYIPWCIGEKNFPLLSVGWYLFRVVSGDRYLPRGSNDNALYITSTGNVFVARWVIPLWWYYFWILSWFTEFSEIHLGKTLIDFSAFWHHMLIIDTIRCVSFSRKYGKRLWNV